MDWFILLQSFGIIGSLLFTALAFRTDAKARRLGNLMELTKQHREIWSHLFTRPELGRVLQINVNLTATPVTDEEAIFLTMLILHLNSSFHAMNEGLFVQPEGLRKDIGWFLALPIPRMVWVKSRPMLNRNFVEFVEANISDLVRG